MKASRAPWIVAVVVAAAAVTATWTGAAGAPAALGGAAEATLNRLVLSARTYVGVPVTATIERRVGNRTQVRLTSSNTSVVTVPSSIWIQRGATTATFDVTPVSGPGGCAVVTATDPDNSVSAKIFTYPRASRLPAALTLRMDVPSNWAQPEYDATVMGTSSVKGIISGTGVAGKTWSLRSSDPAVRVPRSVTAGPMATSVEFTANISGRPDCALFTATESRTTLTRLLVFVDVGG